MCIVILLSWIPILYFGAGGAKVERARIGEGFEEGVSVREGAGSGRGLNFEECVSVREGPAWAQGWSWCRGGRGTRGAGGAGEGQGRVMNCLDS